MSSSFGSQVATIRRFSSTQDASGSYVRTYSDFATGVVCRFEEMTGDEAVRYQREANVKTYAVYFASSVDVRVQDRLLIAGTEMEVRNVHPLRDSSGDTMELRVRADSLK